MPESDFLEIILAHDRWATAQLLDACANLPAEQLQQQFEIGRGSLHDTLTHILGAMRTWTDTLAGRESGPRLETDGQRRTPGQLCSLLDETCAQFGAEARRRPLAELTTRRTRDGWTLELNRAAVLAQVTTHGMHHRAQCLNMLRRLGVAPLPPSSVAEWAMLGG